MPLSFSTSEAPGGTGLFLKSHGRRQAQREFEVKDGAKRRRLRRSPISAFTRVFDALWAILEFKFSLRSNVTVRFKERWLHSSDLIRAIASESRACKNVVTSSAKPVRSKEGAGVGPAFRSSDIPISPDQPINRRKRNAGKRRSPTAASCDAARAQRSAHACRRSTAALT